VIATLKVAVTYYTPLTPLKRRTIIKNMARRKLENSTAQAEAEVFP